MPNRLINETSPYLLQHAHNPVEWYPWGDEALERARKEDKPILLSIGYSACHWCHVMAQECFENAAIAHLMNERFVCVKVDREERPDIDHIYMEAVQAMTGGGGWPLSVFLTPKGEPFHGGTYFPPEDRHGLPGFPRVLLAVADAYSARRSQVAATAEQLVSHLRQRASIKAIPQLLTADILYQAYHALAASFDHDNGGFGPAPKFPQPAVQEFLLRYHHRSQDPQALQVVGLTLDQMATGGIYDQIGGGFHRYATDARWLVPHFEKMLYDNALLSRLYLHAYQATGNTGYRRIAEETLDYVMNEMTDPAGGFYSAQDADTEGVEGKYYVWTTAEVIGLLGQEEGNLIDQYFGISDDGNFDGKNVLHVPKDTERFASDIGARQEELEAVIKRSRKKLLAAREQRVKPHRDEKVVTSWNGLMLHSFAEAACILGREDYRRAAAASADFLLHELRRDDVLMHSYKDGQSKIPGYLDDYAFLISGLLALHEASFKQQWLEEAVSLADAMIQRFWDEGQEGQFYDTEQDHGALFVRPRDILDSVKPCGGSAAADALLRLAIITGETDYENRAAAMLRSVCEQMTAYPLGFGHWLCALDFHLSDPKEITVVGSYHDSGTQDLLRIVHSRYIPNKVLVGVEPGEPYALRAAPLLENRTMEQRRPTAYLCHRYTCLTPTTDPDVLKQQLEG